MATVQVSRRRNEWHALMEENALSLLERRGTIGHVHISSEEMRCLL